MARAVHLEVPVAREEASRLKLGAREASMSGLHKMTEGLSWSSQTLTQTLPLPLILILILTLTCGPKQMAQLAKVEAEPEAKVKEVMMTCLRQWFLPLLLRFRFQFRAMPVPLSYSTARPKFVRTQSTSSSATLRIRLLAIRCDLGHKVSLERPSSLFP